MLVGLTGPSGSKKTIVSKHLADAHNFSRIHAGAPIKKGMRVGFGLTKAEMQGKAMERPNVKLGGQTPRTVSEAQAVSTHKLAPTATAQVIRKRAGARMAKGRDVVVDGVRSPHEAAMIRKMGGTIWRVDNGKGPDPRLPMDQMQEGIEADHTLDSSGRKRELKSQADDLVAKMLGV
jgi:hypothetical protein